MPIRSLVPGNSYDRRLAERAPLWFLVRTIVQLAALMALFFLVADFAGLPMIESAGERMYAAFSTSTLVALMNLWAARRHRGRAS